MSGEITRRMRMAKKTSAGAASRTASRRAGAKATAKTLVDAVQTADEGTHIASADEEAAMRKAATSPAARKAALEAGKKDPLEKFGDPDAEPDQVRRAVFGL
jgi:membrane protease subunit (stomatin/prohibitin family)